MKTLRILVRHGNPVLVWPQRLRNNEWRTVGENKIPSNEWPEVEAFCRRNQIEIVLESEVA